MSSQIALKNLILACLIADGEIAYNGRKLTAIYSKERHLYLMNYAKEHGLSNCLNINPVQQKLTISNEHVELSTIRNRWYEGYQKIFSKRLDKGLLTTDSIILSAILFGDRRIENIAITTSVDQAYIRTLALTLQQHLKVPVIPSSNQIKICDIPRLFMYHIDQLNMLENAEIADFLTNKERSRLVKVLR